MNSFTELGPVVSMPTPADVLNRDYYRMIRLIVKETGVSSRKLIEEISKLPLLGIAIVDPSGQAVEFPDISKVFPTWSERWVSWFLKGSESHPLEPFHYSKKVNRLQLIWLYVRIIHADKDKAARNSLSKM